MKKLSKKARKRIDGNRTPFLDPNNHIFIYFGTPMPKPYYIRIGGLETPFFKHGLSLSDSFTTREDAVIVAREVINYLRSALKVRFDKKIEFI